VPSTIEPDRRSDAVTVPAAGEQGRRTVTERPVLGYCCVPPERGAAAGLRAAEPQKLHTPRVRGERRAARWFTRKRVERTRGRRRGAARNGAGAVGSGRNSGSLGLSAPPSRRPRRARWLSRLRGHRDCTQGRPYICAAPSVQKIA